MIATRLQHYGLINNLIHPCQTGGILQRSTEDAAVAITHHVRHGWASKKVTSVLAFDIAQFFPSLNHEILCKILDHFGYPRELVSFFSEYLVNRYTAYAINGDTSSLYPCSVGVGQGSALSPILSALYISPIFHLLDYWIKFNDSNTKPISSFLSYVDDGLLVATDSTYEDSHSSLVEAYTYITTLFTEFGLVMEHSKTELFNFAKKPGDPNPPIDLGVEPFTGDHPLSPKTTWRYLGVFFDRALTFKDHVKIYSARAYSSAKCIKILGNSARGLLPPHKRLLYISAVIPIATYGLRCWYRPGTRGFITNTKTFNQMHRSASLWITGAFKTTPSGAALALAGLTPMHNILKRLYKKTKSRVATLHKNHPVLALTHKFDANSTVPHPSSLQLASKSRIKAMKSPLDFTNIESIQESFHPLHPKATPGYRLMDIHPTNFTFVPPPPIKTANKDVEEFYQESLSHITSDDPTVICAVTGAKNQSGSTSIPNPSLPLHHHSVYTITQRGNTTFSNSLPAGRRTSMANAYTWAVIMAVSKIHAIATSDHRIKNVHIYTPSVNTIRSHCLFPAVHKNNALNIALAGALEDLVNIRPDVCITVHGYQYNRVTKCSHTIHSTTCPRCIIKHVASVAKHSRFEGKTVFPQSQTLKHRHHIIDNEAVTSWNDEFVNPSSKFFKGRRFLPLKDGYGESTPTLAPTSKGKGPWMGTYLHTSATVSPSLYARFSRAITNHAPIGAYRARFHLDPDRTTSCPGHPETVETRFHILNECDWYARCIVYDYEQIEDFILFLLDNPLAFSFIPIKRPRTEDTDWPKYVANTHSLRNSRLAMIGLPPSHTPIFTWEESVPTLADLRVPRVISRVISVNPYTVVTALETYFEENDTLSPSVNRMSGGNPHA
jgi:hypothetical protein